MLVLVLVLVLVLMLMLVLQRWNLVTNSIVKFGRDIGHPSSSSLETIATYQIANRARMTTTQYIHFVTNVCDIINTLFGLIRPILQAKGLEVRHSVCLIWLTFCFGISACCCHKKLECCRYHLRDVITLFRLLHICPMYDTFYCHKLRITYI